MNDLSGLEWSNKTSSSQKAPNYNTAFSALRSTAGPGQTLPSASTVPFKPPSKPATPVNDSFSNLVSFSNTSNKNVSLQEHQKRLADLKLKQAVGTSNAGEESLGDDAFWNSLESGRNTPSQSKTPVLAADQDDFLAAFGVHKQETTTEKTVLPPARITKRMPEDDDDDPFGLSEFQAKQSAPRQAEVVFGDDDVLGLLGKPVIERPPERHEISKNVEQSAHPQDKAVAELVEMGFPPGKAREALENTESGTDVQAAVGWLLSQAHSESRNRTRTRDSSANGMERPSRSVSARGDSIMPQERRSGTPSNEPSKVASELGASFLKTAGSLWKHGQKRVQQAVQEFNSDSDSSQPKWMRDNKPEPRAQRRPDESGDDRRRSRNSAEKPAANVTDEAMMLEASRPERLQRLPQRSRPDIFDSSAENSRDHSPAVPSRLRENHAPEPTVRARAQVVVSSRTTLSRQAAEEQAATAYVSSARRRKPVSAPTAVVDDLLEQSPRAATQPPTVTKPFSRPPKVPESSKPVPTVVVRPPAPVRNIPVVSAIAMKASHADREAGNEHFKRGDYSSAHQSYSRSLTHLPSSHPITIILLTNRALTALKTGEPKTAVVDSDTAIAIIGPSKGEQETVSLNNGDTAKPMRDYYGKALMRKAEALEQMEKWADAAIVWREAVEGGHGGATSIQGRMRAEKAANPPPKSKPAPARKPPARMIARPSNKIGQTEAEAVSRLRAQNAAAEKADNERFALSDSVEARITAWKGGKADNLRALLGSLDTVLWPEAGWKKISMADLILPNKVKIQYMKGIAKVHPDKIPTDASTEQRMIAGSVFSALNEAWDKFKKENGL